MKAQWHFADQQEIPYTLSCILENGGIYLMFHSTIAPCNILHMAKISVSTYRINHILQIDSHIA